MCGSRAFFFFLPSLFLSSPPTQPAALVIRLHRLTGFLDIPRALLQGGAPTGVQSDAVRLPLQVAQAGYKEEYAPDELKLPARRVLSLEWPGDGRGRGLGGL